MTKKPNAKKQARKDAKPKARAAKPEKKAPPPRKAAPPAKGKVPAKAAPPKAPAAKVAAKAVAKAPARPEKPAKGARPVEGKPEKKGSGRKLSRQEKARLRGLTDEEREALGEEEEAETAEGEEEAETAEADDDAADDLDVTERTEVKALMERGREKGFLTYEEVNDALPSDIVSSDQIDDVMSMFGEHDIEVVDDAKKMKLPDKPPEPEAKAADAEEEKEEEDAGYGKSNDPVRMYLRKMGSVSLLTREGEVEIAKRIEEGEKSVLTSVLASQLAIREILDLGDRLKKGKIRVREIIKDAGEEPVPAEGAEVEVEEEAEVEEAEEVAVEGAEGEPAVPALPKEEEKKVEQVLKHIERIAKLEKDVARQREILEQKKLSDAKRREIREEIKALEGQMIESLEDIGLNKKTIDRIVLRLKGLIKRVEESEREFFDLERHHRMPLREIKRLIAEARADDAARRKAARKLGLTPEEIDELDRIIRAARRKIKRVEEEAKLPVDDLRRTYQAMAEGERTAERAKTRAGRGQPAPGRLHRQEVHQPRPAVPRPDPGGQHRPDEGRGQVRVQARLQVLDLRHLVDPAGHHPRHRRPGPHHPHPGAHDRDHQQAHPHLAATWCRSWAASRRRRRSPRRWSCRSTRSARSSRSPRSPSRSRPPSARRRTATSATSSRTRPSSRPSDAVINMNLAEQTRKVLATLTPREEKVLRMRFGIGEKSDHTLEEVGQDFEVTRERIRQIEAKALRKLRHPSRSKRLKSFVEN